MKYLLALAVVLCLAGCATTSTTQATSQKPTVTNYVMMSDGTIYSWQSEK
jgi:uncharacterized protein YceK